MEDVRNRSTYDLEHVINAFTWYENRYLARAKRELDKRYRVRTLARQNDIAKKEYENNIK